MAILLVQDCSERLFFGWWMGVVYVRRQWGAREITLWFWAVILANVEYHFSFGFTGIHEVLVCTKVLVLFLLRVRY